MKMRWGSVVMVGVVAAGAGGGGGGQRRPGRQVGLFERRPRRRTG
jgi:hypothetical protein